MKKFLIVIVIILSLVLVKRFFLQNNQNNEASLNIGGEASILSVGVSDWIKGNDNTVATLIEYSDLQCPACGLYFPVVKRLQEEFGDRLRFVYRHFPLSQIHKNAEFAAEATEAAGLQGKFWEMHDLLFLQQEEWSSGDAKKLFKDYAEILKLDLDKFEKDINSREVKNAVQSDYDGGVALKVNATPTFFLNGQKIANPRSYDEFHSIILGELSRTK